MIVRFDEALERAVTFAREHLERLGGDVILVRDLLGRIRFALGGTPTDADGLSRALHERLGAFSPGAAQLLLLRSEMLAPEAVFEATELRHVAEGIRLLERWVIGADWLRAPLPRRTRTAARVAFFGIKGGVGRSTALVAAARHMSERGQRVLVLDLDLESPGVTATLLPEGSRPSFGIVDWFVEGDVGQADDDLLREMVATSPLAAGTPGEIRVVPAGGSVGTESYVAKLARVYASPPGAGDLAVRVARLLDALEEQERPDWVFLDSRAGIHDLAAITVMRLDADALLFAVDTPQTWLAYRYLFATWQRDPSLVRRFRDRLRVVAAQVPETERAAYLERLRDHASALFAEYVYDEAEPDDDLAFNFDLKDPDAPHGALPIYWRRELQDWDPTGDRELLTAEQIEAAFGAVFAYLDELLVKEAAPS